MRKDPSGVGARNPACWLGETSGECGIRVGRDPFASRAVELRRGRWRKCAVDLLHLGVTCRALAPGGEFASRFVRLVPNRDPSRVVVLNSEPIVLASPRSSPTNVGAHGVHRFASVMRPERAAAARRRGSARVGRPGTLATTVPVDEMRRGSGARPSSRHQGQTPGLTRAVVSASRPVHHSGRARFGVRARIA